MIDGTQVIIFPEFQEKKEQVERLRVEFTALVEQRDDLLLVQCANIENRYMLLLGNLEYQIYEAQCTLRRLGRKIELIQMKRNREEKVDLPQIEAVLDKEFAEYQQELETRLGQINDALEREKSPILGEKQAKDHKELYHQIVKQLHPDLHPDITKEQLRLFHNAVRAYQDGDTDTLRIIQELVCERLLPDRPAKAMSQLAEEEKRLRDLIKKIREQMEQIKSEYPYIMREILEDEDKLSLRQVELRATHEQVQERIRHYEKRLQEVGG